jgi:hypothetical protein
MASIRLKHMAGDAVLPDSGKFSKKLKSSGRKKYFTARKLERNFSGSSGKISVYILKNYISITQRPSGIHSRTLAYSRRYIFCWLY